MVDIVGIDTAVVGNTYHVVYVIALEVHLALAPEVRELHGIGTLDEVFNIITPSVESIEYLNTEQTYYVVGNLGSRAVLLTIFPLVEHIAYSNCHSGAYLGTLRSDSWDVSYQSLVAIVVDSTVDNGTTA